MGVVPEVWSLVPSIHSMEQPLPPLELMLRGRAAARAGYKQVNIQTCHFGKYIKGRGLGAGKWEGANAEGVALHRGGTSWDLGITGSWGFGQGKNQL